MLCCNDSKWLHIYPRYGRFIQRAVPIQKDDPSKGENTHPCGALIRLLAIVVVIVFLLRFLLHYMKGMTKVHNLMVLE